MPGAQVDTAVVVEVQETALFLVYWQTLVETVEVTEQASVPVVVPEVTELEDVEVELLVVDDAVEESEVVEVVEATEVVESTVVLAAALEGADVVFADVVFALVVLAVVFAVVL